MGIQEAVNDHNHTVDAIKEKEKRKASHKVLTM